MSFQKMGENAVITDSMDLDEDQHPSEDSFRTDVSSHSNKEHQYLGCYSVVKRPYRLATVGLGLLCVLLLTVIIELCIKHTTERNQFQTKHNDLTKDRDQLQTRYNGLMQKVSDCVKPGWRFFNFNCYYLSTAKKSWDDSREDCKEKGADLVIINSKEEQEFLAGWNTRAWIGLIAKGKERTWEWVDHTPLTIKYWMEDEPNGQDEGEDCVEIISTLPETLENWNDLPGSTPRRWICEK